jgi:NADPH-dependent 2,4-dienoyl-CoA reductase/sulfur reductase-like enzyme
MPVEMVRTTERGMATDTARTINTRCCVVGGGPAGLMLGFLLARAGIDVVVLEKHVTFCVIFAATRSIPQPSS